MSLHESSRCAEGHRGKLLIGFHGHRQHGHRVVAMRFAADGTPGEMRELVSGWDLPPGNPVDVETAPDGSVWISEDSKGTVLRLDCIRH